MNSSKLLEILVGVIILGALGWVLVQQYNMNGTVNLMSGTLTTVDTKVGQTNQRVDRIANALPGINVQVAHEEVVKPFQSCIVSTTPIKKQDGQWTMYVHLIDSEKDKMLTYTVSLDNEDDKKTVYSILGVGRYYEPHMRSARQMMAWSAAIKEPNKLPRFVNPSATLCFRNTSADSLKNSLDLLGPTSETILVDAPDDWNLLVKTLNEKPNEFKPDK